MKHHISDVKTVTYNISYIMDPLPIVQTNNESRLDLPPKFEVNEEASKSHSDQNLQRI